MTGRPDAPYYSALRLHVQRYRGPGIGYVPPVGDEGFGVGLHRDGRTGLVSALTLGVPFLAGAGGPVEFLCALQEGQEREAHHLVRVAARWFVSAGEDVAFGEWIRADGPMLPDSGVHGLLFETDPVVGEEFSVFDAAGYGAVRVVVLIPLLASEVELLETPGEGRGRDALWERWRDDRTRLWDARRPGVSGRTVRAASG